MDQRPRTEPAVVHQERGDRQSEPAYRGVDEHPRASRGGPRAGFAIASRSGSRVPGTSVALDGIGDRSHIEGMITVIIIPSCDRRRLNTGASRSRDLSPLGLLGAEGSSATSLCRARLNTSLPRAR